MISLSSYVTLGIHTLKTGLKLYWEDVTYICSKMSAALAPQFGSSLYDPEKSDCTLQPAPIFGVAG